MTRSFATAALCAAVLGISATAAQAHVTLEAPLAAAHSYYKAVLRTPHGCSGLPTIAVRVQIPEGVTAVKPQPKPGWELEIVTQALTTPVTDGHGNTTTSRVAEIRWTGGRLLDAHYDEFVMRVRLPNRPGETVYFPTVQECETGADRWIEIPADGQSPRDLAYPAPRVTLTAPR